MRIGKIFMTVSQSINTLCWNIYIKTTQFCGNICDTNYRQLRSDLLDSFFQEPLAPAHGAVSGCLCSTLAHRNGRLLLAYANEGQVPSCFVFEVGQKLKWGSVSIVGNRW